MTAPAHGTAKRLDALLQTAESARRGMRRDGDEFRPLGPKAAQTRNALLAAAYECFVSKGYGATTVQDIHAAASVSIGTFYQYFRDKADLMSTLVGETIVAAAEEMFPPLDLRDEEPSITRAVERHVSYYVATADFQRVWEEVTFFDGELGTLRWDLGRVIEAGFAEMIRGGQRAGRTDPTLDSESTARALTAMADRHCYRTFVVENRRDAMTVQTTIDTLAELWRKSLAR